MSAPTVKAAAVPAVEVGDTVAGGTVLGTVGQTAIAESAAPSHLHFAIFLDGAPVYANCVVRAGQVLGAVCESPYDQGIVPQAGPLRVLYADEDLLLVDKPAPMATLPTRGKPLGTLAPDHHP